MKTPKNKLREGEFYNFTAQYQLYSSSGSASKFLKLRRSPAVLDINRATPKPIKQDIGWLKNNDRIKSDYSKIY